jgi:hypothetical protein
MRTGDEWGGRWVTESEWLTCDDPDRMLNWLGDRLSSRKALLFACSCGRAQFWRFADPRSRAAVEAAERFADEPVVSDALRAAALAADAAWTDAVYSRGTTPWTHAGKVTALAASKLLAPFRETELRPAAFLGAAAQAAAFARQGTKRSRPAQAALLRDLTCNPFRLVKIDPRVRTPTVVSLGEAANEERTLPAGTLDPVRLNILADALEDAGCTDAELLGHLRSPGPHVRGCWALDLILGKP